MKEATGELSMTVVVIIAVIAIISILTVVLFPLMKNYVQTQWGQMSDTKQWSAEDSTSTP